MKAPIALSTVAALLFAAAPVAQAETSFADLEIAPNASSFSLDNGMEVVVIPDHRAPVVTHMVWYRTGAADEGPGESGVAHFLEHLMFKGTEAHPDGFSDVVTALGGQENAFTSQDYTAYYQQIAKEHLGRMMTFEADRMANLALDEDEVARELDVVLEERRMRVDTNPSAILGESFDATLHVNSPYADPIIGWPDEVSALSREAAISYYDRFYTPENAILVVAGDVTVDEVRALAEDTYGQLESRVDLAPRTRSQTPDLTSLRTVRYADPRVGQPSLRRGWVVPSYATAEPGEAEAIDVLAQVLGGGSTSRLYDELVRDGGPATSVAAWYQSSAVDPDTFGVYAVPRDGVSFDALETAIEASITDVAENGISEEELERAKRSLVADALFAQDSQQRLARIFGLALATGQTVEDVQEWPARIGAVTAEDVQKAAQTHLPLDAGVIGYLEKAEAPGKDS
ncbi:M16 family metallopeptidase [Amorphus orientalis]|uniref:Zinc protease n=1 Tax=Amorphus orientalis TaxID=649198 RepID=A0AAE4ATH6_9HYPH|nr:pitrilysin family protein [Amorphus orientalis]MDQ0316167.1 zinc protease [Amorphus orientalis]